MFGFSLFWGGLFFWFWGVFWPPNEACRILVPQPGIEPVPPAVEVQSPNHWTTKEVLSLSFFLFF